jgi:hypothetical protein
MPSVARLADTGGAGGTATAAGGWAKTGFASTCGRTNAPPISSPGAVVAAVERPDNVRANRKRRSARDMIVPIPTVLSDLIGSAPSTGRSARRGASYLATRPLDLDDQASRDG